MPAKEYNEVKMRGILPSDGMDNIPVTESAPLTSVQVEPKPGADPIPVEVEAWGIDPLSIPPSGFVPYLDTYDWMQDVTFLKNRTVLTAQYFLAAIYLPDKVTVTALTLYGYRDDALSAMQIILYRADRIGGSIAMETVDADWIVGYSSKTESTIANPIIDNINYQYVLQLKLDPNNNVDDVKFSGATITIA